MSLLNLFDRTLTDLDHVRLKDLMRRDLRERLSPSTTQQIEDTLAACAAAATPLAVCPGGLGSLRPRGLPVSISGF
jgi:hypothetical protein